MKYLWLFPITLAICANAAAETGIKTVVNIVENRYAVRHRGVPGLWFAKPFLKCTGLGGLKIATFENFRVPQQTVRPLQETIKQALGPDWAPFVETRSKADQEWTVIFSRTVGDDMKMLIVAGERTDGLTILQVNLSGDAIHRWMDEPLARSREEIPLHPQ